MPRTTTTDPNTAKVLAYLAAHGTSYADDIADHARVHVQADSQLGAEDVVHDVLIQLRAEGKVREVRPGQWAPTTPVTPSAKQARAKKVTP